MWAHRFLDMTTPIAETIGHKMEASDLTLASLAERSDIPRATLQRRMSKPETFTIAELDSIAVGLGFGTGLELMLAKPEPANSAAA